MPRKFLDKLSFTKIGYLEVPNNCQKDEYYDCLDKSCKNLLDMINSEYKDGSLIIDTEDGIASCHSDHYYNGACHYPETEL